MDREARLDRLEANWNALDDERREQAMAEADNDSMRTLDVSEVADLLSLSAQTIRRKLRAGDIPGVQTGKGWRISKVALAEWWRDEGGGPLFDDVQIDEQEDPDDS